MDNFLDMGLKNYVVLEDITNKRPTNPISDGLWKLYFDGALSRNGSDIRVIIEIPNSKMKPHAYKLEFECMNDEAKYESLIEGLELEKYMSIKFLCVFGDSEIVVNQVKNIYKIKKCRDKAYARKVWDLTDHFQAFDITFI